MKAYRYKRQADDNGNIAVTNLPPGETVEIIVLVPDSFSAHEDMQAWINDISQRHPFAKLSKEEVLAKLKATREDVRKERHED